MPSYGTEASWPLSYTWLPTYSPVLITCIDQQYSNSSKRKEKKRGEVKAAIPEPPNVTARCQTAAKAGNLRVK